jgi:hypothetical protein
MKLRLRAWEVVVSLLICSWVVVLSMFHGLGHPRQIAELKLLRLEENLRLISQQVLTEAELKARLDTLPVEMTENGYDIQYDYIDPQRWTIRLTPIRRTSFARSRTLALRLVLLDFYKMTYPDIIVQPSQVKLLKGHVHQQNPVDPVNLV